jgi:hypothetical protein
MKLNLAIPGLLIALLVGCNDTTTVAPTASPSATPSPTTTPVVPEKTPKPTNSPNPFDSLSFPQASCGDKLPKDAKADNLKFYPVFIDYSSNVNLEIVKSKFCGDAIHKNRIDRGGASIQVASFTSEERANQFKQFLASKLGSAEVGKPTIRAIKLKSQPTKDAVAKAAQLTAQQVEQLKNIIFKNTAGKPHKVEAILPTYLPPGFKLDSFKVLSDGRNYGEKYEVSYKNASNNSFKITTIAPGPGAGYSPYAPKFKEVSSPAFGEVIIGYTEFDKTSDKPSTDVIIGVSPPLANNTSENSPSDGGSSVWHYQLHSNTLSLAEATKIVESLSYLYPNEPRNLRFYNLLTNDPEWAPQ